MTERITISEVVGSLKAVIGKLEEKRQELDRLDADIGDGDHGRSIANAFQNIAPLLESQEDDIGQLLNQVGKSMALSAGAACGPLYGTGFMDAGKTVAGKKEIGLPEMAAMLKAFEDGVRRRGKAEVGEKTMLDTIHPMVESANQSLSRELLLKEALEKVKDAARKGMESTKEMVSLKGRSSRLGNRSMGHIDPGAASCYIITEAFVDFLTR